MKLLATSAAVGLLGVSWGTIVLDAPYNSHMVLSARSRISISGYSTRGEEQTITFWKSWNNNVATVRSGKGGRFSFRMFTPPAGGPYLLHVADADGTLTLWNVAMGKVLLVMGQSNAEMPLFAPSTGYPTIPGAEQEANSVNLPNLRYARMGASPSQTTVLHNTAYWFSATTPDVGRVSAVGYYAAKALHAQTGQPVGLVQVVRGGSRIEEWMPRGLIATLPGGAEELNDESGDSYGGIYNGTLFSLRNFGFDAMIWYQGESNAQYATTYEDRLRAFLNYTGEMYRARGKRLVQAVVEVTPLTSADPDGRPWVRSIQNRVATSETVSMVPSGDITLDITNPHPVDKQPLGERIADNLIAAFFTGAQPSRPQFGTPQWQPDGSVRIPVVGGTPPYSLTSTGGFSLVNSLGQPIAATAELDGDVVHVMNYSVVNPTGVRYLWSAAGQPNLFDSTGLPMGVYASDR